MVCGLCMFVVPPDPTPPSGGLGAPRTAAGRALHESRHMAPDICVRDGCGLINSIRRIEAEAARPASPALVDALRAGLEVVIEFATAAFEKGAGETADKRLERWGEMLDLILQNARFALAAQPPAPGVVVERVRCDQCDGQGSYPDGMDRFAIHCLSCAGTGWVTPPEPPLAAADFRMEGVSGAEWDAFAEATTDKAPPAAAGLVEAVRLANDAFADIWTWHDGDDALLDRLPEALVRHIDRAFVATQAALADRAATGDL